MGPRRAGGAGHGLRTHKDVRLPATDRLVVPAVWRALDGCARGGRPTFAENLRQVNRVVDRFEASSTIAPFAVYLKRVNDENDLEARRASAAQTPAAKQMHLSGSGDGAEVEAGKLTITGESPALGLPRLGDLPPVAEVVRQTILRETYQVRNLLSRGAVIDLVG